MSKSEIKTFQIFITVVLALGDLHGAWKGRGIWCCPYWGFVLTNTSTSALSISPRLFGLPSTRTFSSFLVGLWKPPSLAATWTPRLTKLCTSCSFFLSHCILSIEARCLPRLCISCISLTALFLEGRERQDHSISSACPHHKNLPQTLQSTSPGCPHLLNGFPVYLGKKTNCQHDDHDFSHRFRSHRLLLKGEATLRKFKILSVF